MGSTVNLGCSPSSFSSSSSSLWLLGPACAPKPGWSDWPHTHQSAVKGKLNAYLSFDQSVSYSPLHLQPVKEGREWWEHNPCLSTGPFYAPLSPDNLNIGGKWNKQNKPGCRSHHVESGTRQTCRKCHSSVPDPGVYSKVLQKPTLCSSMLL